MDQAIENLRGLRGYTQHLGRWDISCRIVEREPEPAPKTKTQRVAPVAPPKLRKRKKKWPYFILTLMDGTVITRHQADVIIGGILRTELPPESTDPFVRNYPSLEAMARSPEIIEHGVTLGEFLHFYKNKAHPCGYWWKSARGALERPITYLEVFTLFAEPPAPGWVLVTDAYEATAALKSGVAIESELQEAERLAKQARRIKRLEERRAQR